MQQSTKRGRRLTGVGNGKGFCSGSGNVSRAEVASLANGGSGGSRINNGSSTLAAQVVAAESAAVAATIKKLESLMIIMSTIIK